MAGIADFLDSLMGGFDLICFCLLIGSLLWAYFIVQLWCIASDRNAIADILPAAAEQSILVQQTVRLLYLAGFWLAGAQLFKVVLKIWLMMAVLEHWPFPAFADTTQFIFGMLRALLAGMLAAYAYFYLRFHAHQHGAWLLALLLSLPLLTVGAWLAHAAGRFENRALLMLLTVFHQIGAAAWVGGVLQLIQLWRLCKRKLINQAAWPYYLRRFSRYGISAVLLLLISGVPIALQYIDTWNGLIGSGYGNLLMVKVLLLGLTFCLVYLNRRTVQQYFLAANVWAVFRRVPHFIEAETALLVALLFTAASLASQPPANDIANLTASWQEVLHAFAPRWPRVDSPSHQALLAGEAGRVAIVGQVPSPAATEWSDYNHNIAGIFLTGMGFLAMLSYVKFLPAPLSLLVRYEGLNRYWPLGFMGLGIFLFFRSDAESWPLGPIGFWESTFNNGEILQHRIATLLVFVLGVMELRARNSHDIKNRLAYVFPVLAGFGGLMLLTHSHVGFQPKSAFLIQVGHTLMGVFSLVLAGGRWLELNLDKPGKDIAGFVSVAALFQIGLVLMFYREPLY